MHLSEHNIICCTNEWNELSNFLYNRAERLGRRAELGFNRGMAFDAVKAQHDNAGISMSARDYIGEIVVRELETIFSSAEEFNSFIAEIESNQQARTAWQKIVDYIFEIIDDIKRALSQAKLSKADRAEANAQLERIKELYAKAYIATRDAVAERAKTQANQSAETQKNTDIEGNLSFDLKTFDGKSIVWIEESGLTNKQLNNHQAVAEYIEQHIGDVYTIIESGQKVYIGEELPQEYTQSKYTTYLRNVNRTAARGKNKAIDGFGELIETATNRRWEKTKHAQNKDAKYGMYRYDNSFAFPIKDNKGKVTNIRAFDVELLIRNASDGNKYLYDIVGIKENTTTEIGILERMTRLPAERQATRDSVSNEIVPQNPKSVKSDFSLKEKETNVENTSQFSLKASNNGIYDYTKSFAQQVDDWKNGLIPQNDSLLVGATPKVFKKIGFNPLPFTINQRHIDYAINGTKDIDHSLGETLLAQLPQALENPLAIISSQTQPDRVVAILKIQHKGKNIVAPVEIDGFARQNNIRIDSNAIASVFGKGNAITKLLTDALNSEIKGSISVFYWNKKEAVSLLQRAGLQLSGGLPQDGFIHSITENGSPVKQRLKNITESQQFKRWFGNSKVVNKDGTPKIVYHGTSKGGHTVFDAWGKGKFGLFGIGIYMTESREVAEGYTKKGKGITPRVYELYANITNPLDMDKTANVKKWKKQTLGEIDFSNCTTNEDCFRAVKEYCEDEQMVRWEAEEYITEIIRDMGYDGITHIGGGRYNKQDATRHRVWIALDSTQIKSATDNIGTFDNSNPDIRYSLKGTLSDSEIRNAITDKKLHKYVDKGIITTEKYDELVKTYGAIPSGEKPHREIQVPQKTAKDKKVSQTVRTILEAKATPDEAVPTIEKMVEDGIFSYDVYTDKQALDEANSNIKKYGWDESIDDWFKDVEKGVVSKQHTAMGWALYNNAANIAATTTSETERTSAVKTSLKILDAMVRHQRSAAQALQATRILKKLSPETQLYAVQKSVQAFQKELSDRYGDKAPNLEIDEELAEQFLNAKTPEERAEIETEIYKDIGRQIFKFKPLEMARKGNSALLEKEDMWFARPHYAYALAQYCKANNITAEQIKRGKAIAPARDYAIKEAQKATYRDTNAFSQFVSDLGKNGKVNYVPKPVSMVVDGILPFRKTPANILVRGVEYSPLGLLKGLSYDLYQVSKGKMSATEAIDNISAGLTGTVLLGLGVFLAAQGLIRGHGEEDEEEKEFKELMGHQSYALELPNGQSITLDWLAPESLPFFVGVNIWETTKGSDEELTLSTILNSVRNITEPMLEMSCLQGLNDLFEGIGYAKSNDTSALVAFLSSAVKSYLMQGLPTMLGQAERTGEEHRMTTYTEKDDFLTGDMQYTLGKASAKIPFWDYHQIPYIDAWGRKEASGVALKRGLNNFLNPAYTSSVKTSKMEKELLRLYESTGEASVFPSRADKYFTVDKKRKDLTADEYVRYATLKGKKSYKLITDLVKSDAYEILDDGEKVKAIEEAYDYANQKAKEAISNYKLDTWVSKADEFSDVGSYITFRTEVSATKKENGDKISKQEVADIILDMAQNDSDMWNMYLSMYDSKGDKYAYDSGVSGEAYMYFLETLNEVDTPNKSGKYGTYTQAEAKEAVNQLEGLSREEQRALWQSVNTTWKRNPF